jgi:peroxiredoxin
MEEVGMRTLVAAVRLRRGVAALPDGVEAVRVADDLTALPPELPVPEDDGAADDLPGMAVPGLALPSTAGGAAPLAPAGRTVLAFVFPWAGRPGEPLPAEGWDAIPGARGCTAEACAFRELHAELRELGLDVVGVSAQDPERQAEVVERLGLLYPLLSDERLELARAMGLPTFPAGERELLRRLTMLVRDGRIARVWYPVFPPDGHADQVLADLRG